VEDYVEHERKAHIEVNEKKMLQSSTFMLVMISIRAILIGLLTHQ
jgi:hypothetical protein